MRLRELIVSSSILCLLRLLLPDPLLDHRDDGVEFGVAVERLRSLIQRSLELGQTLLEVGPVAGVVRR